MADEPYERHPVIRGCRQSRLPISEAKVPTARPCRHSPVAITAPALVPKPPYRYKARLPLPDLPYPSSHTPLRISLAFAGFRWRSQREGGASARRLLTSPPSRPNLIDEASGMLPTPDTSHVNYESTYEPAEDSFLLLDTLESESGYLTQRFSGSHLSPVVIEVGTGSGVVIAFLAAHRQKILGRRACLCFGVDVNHEASVGTRITVSKAIAARGGSAERTYSWNGGLFDQVDGDLLTSFKPSSVDLLVFNPPYVPTETLPSPCSLPSNESGMECSDALPLSWAGGIDGMQVTHRLLAMLPNALSPVGVAYILLCRQNKPEDVKALIRSWGDDWTVQTVGSSGKRAGWEKLEIIRIARI